MEQPHQLAHVRLRRRLGDALQAERLVHRLAAAREDALHGCVARGSLLGADSELLHVVVIVAPAATLSGEGQSGPSFCRLFGTTDLFDAATMAALYVDRAGYVQAVTGAATDAVSSGFLLRADADRIIAAAPLQWDSLAP